MGIPEALELLRKFGDEIACLRTLHHSDNRVKLWKNKVDVVVKAAFGSDSEEYGWLPSSVFWSPTGNHQEDHLLELNEYELGIQKIIQKYGILGIPTVSHAARAVETAEVTEWVMEVRELPQAFIAHSGESLALTKLRQFFEALGITPIIAEEQPSEGRSIDEQVKWCLGQCNCALVLATKGDIDSKTGEFIPRGNILIEVGRCQERFSEKTIYLLEEQAKFPSNISEKVWERFTQDNMERAFIKVAKELRAFGIIKTVYPE